MKSIAVGGVRIDLLSHSQAVDFVLASGTGSRSVHLCNSYTVALASHDPGLSLVLERSSANLADGAPVAWLARRRARAAIGVGVRGPDLMESCLREGRSVGLRHYLYGSTPEVLRDLHATISQQWPGCLVVGAESPAFGDLTDTDRASADVRFRVTEADVVWVGLGTPKQDFVVDRLAQSGAATFVAIGAGFDFLAGTKRRAPSWMQRAGLEWVFRLYSEPRRLWRRYLIGNLQFLVAVARHR